MVKYSSKELFELLLNRFKKVGYDVMREFLYGHSSPDIIRLMLCHNVFSVNEIKNLMYTMSFSSDNFNTTLEKALESYGDYARKTIFAKY